MNTLITALKNRNADTAGGLDAAIADIGGTRGLSDRGRTVIITNDNVFVYDCSENIYWNPAKAVREFASVNDAEAYARRERVGEANFRAIVKALADEAECDAYGRM